MNDKIEYNNCNYKECKYQSWKDYDCSYCNYFNKEIEDIYGLINKNCEGFSLSKTCDRCKYGRYRYYEEDDIDYYCDLQKKNKVIMTELDINYNCYSYDKKQCNIDKFEEI